MPNRPDSAKGFESNNKQVSAIHLWSLTLPEGIQTPFSSKHDLNESTYENDQWKIVCRSMGSAHDCQLKWQRLAFCQFNWQRMAFCQLKWQTITGKMPWAFYASHLGLDHLASWSGKQLLGICHGLDCESEPKWIFSLAPCSARPVY